MRAGVGDLGFCGVFLLRLLGVSGVATDGEERRRGRRRYVRGEEADLGQPKCEADG
jgi:hypothetical protein